MQRDRDDRERERERAYDREREREYARDVRERDRFPPPPVRSSSFMRGLPPPNLSASRGYYPPSPSIGVGGRGDLPPSSGGHDPSGWGSGARGSVPPGMGPGGSPVVPTSELRGGRWSPPPPISRSPTRRFDRLPSLVDYPPVSSGPGPSSGGHPLAGPGPRHWEGPPPPHYPRDVPREEMSHSSGPGAEMFEESTSSSRASATKHTVPSAEEEQPRKKKRRQAFSCNECAKRKQKCNRQTPCQHCVSRKVEALCISSAEARERALALASSGADTTSPSVSRTKMKGEPVDRKPNISGNDERPTSSSGPTPSLSVRVNKLEKMMNAMLNRVDGLDSSALTEWRLHHHVAKSPPPHRPLLEPLSGTAQSASSGHSSESWNPGSGQQRDGPTQGALGVDYHGSVGEQMEHIVEEGPRATLQKSVQDLPPKEFSDKLVSFFFEEINDFRYPIDQRLFERAYEAVYASPSDSSEQSVLALPLVFAVLSTAMRFAPVEWAGPDDTRLKRSVKFFWGAHFAIGISASLNAENLHFGHLSRSRLPVLVVSH